MYSVSYTHIDVYKRQLITYSRCPELTGYVAKDGMIKIPLLSHWMKRLYCLFLNRDDIKEGLKTILKGIDQIKAGISMCIFPEGTRNKDPKAPMRPFKEGSLKMAEKTGCAIIPLSLIHILAMAFKRTSLIAYLICTLYTVFCFPSYCITKNTKVNL